MPQRVPITPEMKQRPDCQAANPYVSAKADAKLEEIATRKPMVTDIDKVAQSTGGSTRRTIGR